MAAASDSGRFSYTRDGCTTHGAAIPVRIWRAIHAGSRCAGSNCSAAPGTKGEASADTPSGRSPAPALSCGRGGPALPAHDRAFRRGRDPGAGHGELVSSLRHRRAVLVRTDRHQARAGILAPRQLESAADAAAQAIRGAVPPGGHLRFDLQGPGRPAFHASGGTGAHRRLRALPRFLDAAENVQRRSADLTRR